MRVRQQALTGPAAAALYELDGFRRIVWPALWCAPYGGVRGDRVILTRRWEPPTLIGDVPVAPLPTVLRHLNTVPADLLALPDIAPIDRVELAVEHSLREGADMDIALGGRQAGDRMLREVMARRGDPIPTESYAETRAVQLMRTWGVVPWRQIPIVVNGRIEYRTDFMLPFRPGPRPSLFTPQHGVLLEVDGRESHETQFERDRQRDATYCALQFHWLVVTPNQVERRPEFVYRALTGAFNRAGYPFA